MSQFEGCFSLSEGEQSLVWTANDENFIVLASEQDENQVFILTLSTDPVTVNEKLFWSANINRQSDQLILKVQENSQGNMGVFLQGDEYSFLIPFSDRGFNETIPFEVYSNSGVNFAWADENESTALVLVNSTPPDGAKKKWIIKPATHFVQ